MTRITNTGARPEGGYDRHGNRFALMPGESREIDISARYERTLRQRAGAMKVSELSPPSDALKKLAADAPEGTGNPSRDLLARAGDMHHATLKAEAAKILGAENTPAKKEDILAELTILAEG